MWTSENRFHYERRGLRYPTDLMDAEWALVEPHIRPAKRGGRPRTTNMREVVNAILYLLGTGCLSCCRFRGHRDRCFMEPEVGYGTTEIYTRVQA
jgi:Putative transposase of IS4/5 family (DUF4096)